MDLWAPLSQLVKRYKRVWTRWWLWYAWLQDNYQLLSPQSRNALAAPLAPIGTGGTPEHSAEPENWIDLPLEEIVLCLTSEDLERLLLELLENSGETVEPAEFAELWDDTAVRRDIFDLARRESLPCIGFFTLLQEAELSAESAFREAASLPRILGHSCQARECCQRIRAAMVGVLNAAEAFTQMLVEFLQAVVQVDGVDLIAREKEGSGRDKGQTRPWCPSWGQRLTFLKCLAHQTEEEAEQPLRLFAAKLRAVIDILDRIREVRNECGHDVADLVPGHTLPSVFQHQAAEIYRLCKDLREAVNALEQMPATARLWFAGKDRYGRMRVIFDTEMGLHDAYSTEFDQGSM